MEGNTASYESQAGVTFDLASLNSGLKETISLADASQPTSLDFELDVAEGLNPSIDKDGSLPVRDQDGKLFAVLPAPVVSDSAPDSRSNSDAVSYSLSGVSQGKWRLTVAVSKAWLEDPSRWGQLFRQDAIWRRKESASPCGTLDWLRRWMSR